MADTDLEPDNLYLAKTIGDEYWFLYEIDATSSNHQDKMISLLNVLINVLAEDRFLPIAAPPNRDRRNSAGATLNLPVKVFIDILEDTQELNNLRYEYLKGVVANVSGGSETVYQVDSRYIDICNRLNLGAPDLEAKGHPMRGRKDLIGFEVDRFFRLTKFCKPRLLSVGQRLFDYLGIKPTAIPSGLEGIAIKKVELKKTQSTENVAKYVIRETIEASEMKGIGTAYTIYHLFGERVLGDAAYGPVPGLESLMEETRAFLAESGFYAIDRDRLLP